MGTLRKTLKLKFFHVVVQYRLTKRVTLKNMHICYEIHDLLMSRYISVNVQNFISVILLNYTFWVISHERSTNMELCEINQVISDSIKFSSAENVFLIIEILHILYVVMKFDKYVGWSTNLENHYYN